MEARVWVRKEQNDIVRSSATASRASSRRRLGSQGRRGEGDRKARLEEATSQGR
ncbi:hypothetical protein RchiOBHm_Chr6g0267771 [Rosa chinensis]|uniref:Uncharacterized protein n=1 Tax=Rosa chinensis TaxID=74649 RepID=A0A2P6PQ04_ROSCH|nr:hypothetical protein RchiOBHm_Chr6g0267771 [Rosa chinensis]